MRPIAVFSAFISTRFAGAFVSLLAVLALVLVAPLMAQGPSQAAGEKKVRVLIATGVNNHDWRATTPVLREILDQTGRFDVRVNEEMQGATLETFQEYDVLLLNWNDWKKTRGKWWSEATLTAMFEYVRSGKGLVVYHASNNAFWGYEEFDRLVGGTWRDTAGHAPLHTYMVENKSPEHPIMRGIPAFQTRDELYHRLDMQPNIQLLASAFDDPKNCNKQGTNCGTGRHEPVLWTLSYGEGRVFHAVLGHNVEALKFPGFIATLQRGTEWAATGEVTIPLPEGLAAR
jgi:uncharacterized protein